MRPTVLYFDDETACLKALGEVLGSDYEVATASTLADARLLLAGREFDVVISDYWMPEIDGVSFLREVAELRPESRRVLLTGNVNVGHVFREVGAGLIQHFAAKPCGEREVRELLERAFLPAPPS